MDLKIPQALIEDHMEMFAQLDRAASEGGLTGATASKILVVMKPHAEREERFALPPLGLLPVLANGEVNFDMTEAGYLAEALRLEMPKMLSEHKEILKAVEVFAAAVKQEGKLSYLELVNRMKLHVEEEEQVYYPAAELVGAYLRLKLAVVFTQKFP